jgi:hypothetical protein
LFRVIAPAHRCAGGSHHAALSHMAVSNALLMSGMFVPKPAFALALLLAFGAGFSMTGAASAARSHDPFS